MLCFWLGSNWLSKISRTGQNGVISKVTAQLVKGTSWALLNNISEDFLVPSNPRWSFVFCFLCRRRLISQRSSLETLEDIEENAPLRRSFYLLSLWLLVCTACARTDLLSLRLLESSWVFTLRCSSQWVEWNLTHHCKVVGDMNYMFPGFRFLNKKVSI